MSTEWTADDYSEDMMPADEGQVPINIHGEEEDLAVYPDQTDAPLPDDDEDQA